MSYVGSSAAVIPVGFSGVNSQSFNGDGSTVAFPLNRPVSTVKAIEVVVNNVQQSPYDGSYSVNSTTLTFSAAPSTGTANIYVIYRDFPVGSITDPNTYTKAQTDALVTGRVAKTGDTMTGNLNQVKSMTSQYDGIGVLMGSSTANTNRSATFLQHTYVDAGGNQGSYVYNHSLRQTDGAYIANVYTADYSAGVHSWYNPNGGLSGNTVMQIDSAGRVTMPYQPCFSVREDGSSSYTNGQYAKLDSIQVNVGGGYNASTGLFTAPVAGNYLITSQLMTTNGTGRAIYYLYRNGSQYMEASSASTDYNDAQATTIMYLSAGDTCGIVVGSGTFYGTCQTQNFFCGHLIG